LASELRKPVQATAQSTQSCSPRAYYLPLMTLADEGPGYGMDFMRLVNVQPAKISEIRAVQP